MMRFPLEQLATPDRIAAYEESVAGLETELATFLGTNPDLTDPERDFMERWLAAIRSGKVLGESKDDEVSETACAKFVAFCERRLGR